MIQRSLFISAVCLAATLTTPVLSLNLNKGKDDGAVIFKGKNILYDEDSVNGNMDVGVTNPET